MVRAFLLIGMVMVLLGGCESKEEKQKSADAKFKKEIAEDFKIDPSKQKKQSEIKW